MTEEQNQQRWVVLCDDRVPRGREQGEGCNYPQKAFNHSHDEIHIQPPWEAQTPCPQEPGSCSAAPFATWTPKFSLLAWP